MLRKIYPWLLPVAVSLLLVLAFSVLRILGEPQETYTGFTPMLDKWALDEFEIAIYYGWYEGRVFSKTMERPAQADVVFPVPDAEASSGP